MNRRAQGRESKRRVWRRNRGLAPACAVLFALAYTAVLPEFRIVSAATTTISGTVFEDKNYGGGLGRSNATASGVGLNAVRLELYNATTGAFVATTTTNASGVYSFSAVTTGILYTIRVVNSTVPSARTGYTTACLPVQTFRTTIAGSGVGIADPARVGGEAPDKIDAASNTTSANFSTLTTATTIAESQTTTTANLSGAITGLDFGFNFDTIVNKNDTGMGSLRQFITNANLLSNTGLAQVGQTSGVEVSIFMIADGSAHSGLRSGLTNQLTSGVAIITPTSVLPTISGASTTIDGTTQTANVGDTNSGTLGTGGTVGVDAISLPTVNKPEVQILGTSSANSGLVISASTVTIKGIAIYGFTATSSVDILFNSGFTGLTVQNCIIGASATSFTDPGVGTRSKGQGLNLNSPATITNNLIGFHTSSGMDITNPTAGTTYTIEGNEIRNNGLGNVIRAGIRIQSSATSTNFIRYNLLVANVGAGMAGTTSSSSGNNVVNNTISSNGGSSVSYGIGFQNANSTVDRNIITDNYGAGVMIFNSGSQNLITQNSIYSNGRGTGQTGIDLLNSSDTPSVGTAPYVTLNDSGDTDTGGNGLANYPILSTAAISGSNLTITGYARPGASIELFISDNNASGFGSGQTYLTTLTEGSGSAPIDNDATSGTYSGTINGINQGTDTTNRFSFTVATPAGVGSGTKLTATATISNNTSEFSGNVTVTASYTISGTVFEDKNYGGGAGRSLASSSGVARAGARVEIFDSGGSYQTFATTDGSGNYAFSALLAGTYTVRVVSGSVTSSRGGTGLLSVQTYRTDASSGAAVAVTDRVGGQTPGKADAGNGSTTLAALTTATTTAQSITTVTLGSNNITGVDFGYSFNVIVNKNNE